MMLEHRALARSARARLRAVATAGVVAAAALGLATATVPAHASTTGTRTTASAGTTTATTAAAAAPSRIGLMGHRCKEYPAGNNHENTVRSLREVSRLGGVWCEIDTWRSADGWQFVWHDPTWGRVARPGTTAGLPRRVEDATKAQIANVRTTGGDKVDGLTRMIRAAGRYDVNLLIEVKNGIKDAKKWVRKGKRNHVGLRWYQDLDSGTCKASKLRWLKKHGAKIGAKVMDHCPITPQEAADAGFRFVTLGNTDLTRPGAVARWEDAGVKPWGRGAPESSWNRLVALDVPRIIVGDPDLAVSQLW